MSKTPFMPLWVSDFLGDTMDLDAAEIGAYMLLLMAQWNRDGESLPNDSEKLKRICRCGRGWPKVWGVLERFFQTDENGIYSKRLRLEAASVASKREVNAHNGASGGKAKALKYNKTPIANAMDSLQRNASIPEPEPYKDSEDKSSGADAPPADPEKVMFDSGVRLLGGAGIAAGKARAMIGKWRKDHNTEAVLVALGRAQREGAIDPVAFIEGCFRFKSKTDTPKPGEMRELPDGRCQSYDPFLGWIKANV